MTKYSSLLLIIGLAFLLMVITAQLPLANSPMLAGQSIVTNAPQQVGTANIVTAVVLAYRGMDTLGELSILFTAAAIVTLLLNVKHDSTRSHKSTRDNAGFVAINAIELLLPLLLVVGFYIIFHGHLTPGGGFQGGVVLATAFFMPYLVKPNQKTIEHSKLSLIESLSGLAFIGIGLVSLYSGQSFLQPWLGLGQLGNLWSAGTLPLLYLAVGLKVGAELAGLLMGLLYAEDES